MDESLKGLQGPGLEGFGPGAYYGFAIDHMGCASRMQLQHGHPWESLLRNGEGRTPQSLQSASKREMGR